MSDSESGWSTDSLWEVWPADDDRKQMESWVKYALANDEKCAPPERIVRHFDLLDKAWGWDRLVPSHFVDWSIYTNYLKEYYNRNSLEYVAGAAQNPEDWPLKSAARAEQIVTNGGGNGNGLAAAAEFCIKMEEQLQSELKNREEQVKNVIILSTLIQQHARLMIRGEFSPVAAAALLCIAKEADLMCEFLRRGADLTGFFMRVSDEIRLCSLSLMNYNGCESVAAAAAMVGISKEAKLMCEWMRKEDELIVIHDTSLPDDIYECDTIRCCTFHLMVRILENSSAAAAAPVHNPGKVESASEAAHDGNGNGIAAAEAAKSTGVNTCEKLNCQGHNKNNTEKSKRKRSKKKTKKQRTEVESSEKNASLNLTITKKKRKRNSQERRKRKAAIDRVMDAAAKCGRCTGSN